MSGIAETRGVGSTIFVLDAFTALAIAVVATGLCAIPSQDRSSLPAMPLFFVVLFLAAWAGGAWGIRFMSGEWAVLYWAPYLAASVVLGGLLITLAGVPACRASVEKATSGGPGARRGLTLAEASLGLLAGLLALVIALNYWSRYMA